MQASVTVWYSMHVTKKSHSGGLLSQHSFTVPGVPIVVVLAGLFCMEGGHAGGCAPHVDGFMVTVQEQ